MCDDRPVGGGGEAKGSPSGSKRCERVIVRNQLLETGGEPVAEASYDDRAWSGSTCLSPS